MSAIPSSTESSRSPARRDGSRRSATVTAARARSSIPAETSTATTPVEPLCEHGGHTARPAAHLDARASARVGSEPAEQALRAPPARSRDRRRTRRRGRTRPPRPTSPSSRARAPSEGTFKVRQWSKPSCGRPARTCCRSRRATRATRRGRSATGSSRRRSRWTAGSSAHSRASFRTGACTWSAGARTGSSACASASR